MTPYEEHLPCLNPSCKSHGKPHPNCRCYGAMAEGGEAKRFCSEDRSHNPDCEYYAGGGEALPAFEDTQDPLPKFEDTQDALPAFEDTKEPDQLPAFEDTEPSNEDKYGTTEQQIKTAAEGAFQGLAGPLATLVETKLLGVKPEDIAGRANTNPLIHGGFEAAGLVGSMAVGTGEGALIAKAAEAVPEISAIGKIGSAAIRNAIQGGLIAGSDEINKAILGQQGGDPGAAVSSALIHMGGAALLTSATGGLFPVISKMAGDLSSTVAGQVVNRGIGLLEKIGAAEDPLAHVVALGSGIYHGYQDYKNSEDGGLEDILHAVKTGGREAADVEIYAAFLEKAFPKQIPKMNEYVRNAVMAALSNDSPYGIPTAINWGKRISKGISTTVPAIDSFFKAGSAEIAPEATDSAVNSIKEYINKGGINQNLQNQYHHQQTTRPMIPIGFAKGGLVPENPQINNQPDFFGKIFPEQNIMINAAKGRVSNYLNSLKPDSIQQKAPFDDHFNNADKNRTYENALKIAAQPLSVMNKIQKGTLTPDDVSHFKSLYPEVHDFLSKKMTERITKAQLRGEKPSYAKRQSMSLFLGATLDGSLSQPAIAAAQAVFNQQQMAQQAQPQAQKKKKNTAPLSKSSQSFLTGDQAREQRQQNQKA